MDNRAKYLGMIDEVLEEPNSLSKDWVELLAQMRVRLSAPAHPVAAGRLTQRNGVDGKPYFVGCFERCGGDPDREKCNTCEMELQICNRLAEYEDYEDLTGEAFRIVGEYSRKLMQKWMEEELLREAVQKTSILFYPEKKTALALIKELHGCDECRLMILPVVPRMKARSENEVKVIEDGEIWSYHVTEIIVGENGDGRGEVMFCTMDGDAFPIREFGKRVFLSEESARRALEGAKHAD